MSLVQLTMFIENEAGRLLPLTGALAENGISIKSVCVADTTDYGLVRLIVDKPEEACRALKEKGFSVRRTEIAAVQMENVPGGLHKVVEAVAAAGISIEYMYSFFGGESGMCFAGMKADDTSALT
ncbi:MAG: hypothetical protein ILO36_01985, partial [Abditibacteriota bacterium]|nr:hypothetical protein [Abditibacteriota bacterium]